MSWLHAPEESSDDELVFRPEGYPLRPARGRIVLDASRAAYKPGPVDVPVPAELEGWKLATVEPDRVTFRRA
jgi:hypothetical protein